MAAQIVEDDDIIGLKFRDEHLNHIIEKTRPIDWSIDDEGSDDSLVPQPGDEGCRFPAAIGDLGADPASALGTSTMANHICLRPCFVDEDKTRGIKFWLRLEPCRSRRSDIGTILLVSASFFKCDLVGFQEAPDRADRRAHPALLM